MCRGLRAITNIIILAYRPWDYYCYHDNDHYNKADNDE